VALLQEVEKDSQYLVEGMDGSRWKSDDIPANEAVEVAAHATTLHIISIGGTIPDCGDEDGNIRNFEQMLKI
jgi:hypothetical protein